ncbi:MAG: hypothetical protein IKA50_06130 [Clostridia bacterium]|nr:hypothetical protein [Clostridia bacterium]
MAIELTKELIDLAHTKYATLWDKDWEQTTSRLLPHVSQIPSPQGKYYRFPRLGGTSMREYVSNDEDVVFDKINVGDYGFKYRKFHSEIPLNDDDNVEAYDLMFNLDLIRAAQVPAVSRFTDEIILGTIQDKSTGKYRPKTASDPGNSGGILGLSYSGEDGSTSHSLDLTCASFQAGKGNLVPSDYATSGKGVSSVFAGTLVDRMKYVVRRLSENEAFNATDPSELCLIISPAVAQVLGSLELSLNRDYPLGDLGDIGRPVFNRAIGATIIQSNMLPTMDAETIAGQTVPGARMCVAYLKSQIGFGRWRNTEFRIKEISTKVATDYYVRVRGIAGCGRKRDDAVYVLPVLES